MTQAAGIVGNKYGVTAGTVSRDTMEFRPKRAPSDRATPPGVRVLERESDVVRYRVGLTDTLRDAVTLGLSTRRNKESEVYLFGDNRSSNPTATCFLMGDIRCFTLEEARAETRRIKALLDGGHDPRPYMRRQWCCLCKSSWDTDVGQANGVTCLDCRSMGCAECGKRYEGSGQDAVAVAAGRKRWCSRACLMKSRARKGYECDNCGTSFKGRSNTANKYCSRACAFADQDTWNRTQAIPTLEKVCDECGVTYLRAPL